MHHLIEQHTAAHILARHIRILIILISMHRCQTFSHNTAHGKNTSDTALCQKLFQILNARMEPVLITYKYFQLLFRSDLCKLLYPIQTV